MTDIFCELLSIKEPQTMLQNRESTVKVIGKCWIKTPRRGLGIEVALFICVGKIGLVILAV